jgi:hypothetical protein
VPRWMQRVAAAMWIYFVFGAILAVGLQDWGGFLVAALVLLSIGVAVGAILSMVFAAMNLFGK